MKKIFVTLFYALLIISCQGQPVELSINLKEGDNFKQTMIMRSRVIQDFNGEKLGKETITKSYVSFRVKKADENGYELEIKYDSLSTVSKMPGDTIQASSGKKGTVDLLDKLLGAMTNVPYQMVITKKGKILEIKNFDNIFASMRNTLPADMPEKIKEMFIDQMKKSFGEDVMKQNFETLNDIYPEKPVRPGDSWTTEGNAKKPLLMHYANVYTLKEITPEYYLITGKSEIKTVDQEGDSIKLGNISVRLDLSGNATISFKIDKNTGWVMEIRMKQKMKGNFYYEKNAQFPDGLTIPATIENEITVITPR